MAKLPELPVWLKPYTVDELEQEERRNQDALRRGEAAFGDDGLIAHYRAKGDPLLEFADIIPLVIAAMPEKTLVGLTHLFVLSTKMGQFPTPGAGLGPLDTVTDLFDFFHLRAAAGQDFTPTLWMVEAAPLAMRARRAVWVEWLRAQGLAVHSMLVHGLVTDHQPDKRGISVVQQRAQTAESPLDPASSTTKRAHRSPVRDRVEAAMRKDIADKKLTLGELRAMTEEALLARYSQYCKSRDSCREARKRVVLANPVINPAS